MLIKKGDMVLNVVWDIKVNETRRYEQHILAGYLPERIKQVGRSYLRLGKEWFFGQGEKDKRTGEWVKDSIRIVRVKDVIPDRETELMLKQLAVAFLWFYHKTSRKSVCLIDSSFDIIAMFGAGMDRIRLMDGLDQAKKALNRSENSI